MRSQTFTALCESDSPRLVACIFTCFSLCACSRCFPSDVKEEVLTTWFINKSFVQGIGIMGAGKFGSSPPPPSSLAQSLLSTLSCLLHPLSLNSFPFLPLASSSHSISPFSPSLLSFFPPSLSLLFPPLPPYPGCSNLCCMLHCHVRL